jgi:integrase
MPGPAAGLGRKLRLTIPPQQRQEEITVMTREQLTAFLSAAKRMPLPYSRFGEGPALQWQDVNFGDSTFRVQRSLSNGHLTTPKAGYGRDLQIGPQLAQVLSQVSQGGSVVVALHPTR